MIKNNNQKLVKQIYDQLTKSKKVSIFCHLNPDNDAYSASLGLCIFLNSMGIKAKIVGMESATNPEVIKQMDVSYHSSDEKFVKDSTAIVLDLGTKKNLIDANLFSLCKNSLRIDHHPKTETFCDLEWVDTNYCSTSEMIGWFILFNNKKMMSKKICNALYPGILTDSGNLMFPSAQASAFELIAHFFDYDFDKQQKQNELFLKDWDQAKTNANILKKVKIVDNEIAYLVITKRIKRKYHLVDNDSKIFLMSNIKNFKVWFSVYYSDQRKLWKVSIRSRTYPVNEVAMKFGGGGHKLASGFTINSKKDIKNIINEIKIMLSKNNA